MNYQNQKISPLPQITFKRKKKTVQPISSPQQKAFYKGFIPGKPKVQRIQMTNQYIQNKVKQGKVESIKQIIQRVLKNNQSGLTLKEIKEQAYGKIDQTKKRIQRFFEWNRQLLSDYKNDIKMNPKLINNIDSLIDEMLIIYYRQKQKLQNISNSESLDEFFQNNQQLQAKYNLIQSITSKQINKIQSIMTEISVIIHKNQNKKQKQLLQCQASSFHILNKLIQIEIKTNIKPYPNYKYPECKRNTINEQEEYSTMYNIRIDEKAFSGLQDGNWITSSVIMNYIEFLKQAFNYNKPQSKCYIMNESQSGSISNPQDFSNNLNSNQKSINKIKLFKDFNKIGAIINKHNTHWFFIGIFTQEKSIVIYDSISSPEEAYRPYIDAFRSYITWETKQNPLSYKVIKNADNTLQQKNGSDCGLCTLINLTQFLNETTFQNYKINYNYDKVKQLRIGLHFFLVYLIYCKNEQIYPNFDYLCYCSKAIIQSKDDSWKSLF